MFEEWEKVKDQIRSQLWASESLVPVPIKPEETALIIVDMNYGCASEDYGMGAVAKEKGQTDEFKWFFERMPRTLQNQQGLIKLCREKNIEIIYTSVSSLTRDCRDMSYFYTRTLPIATPIDSKEAQIRDEIKPQADEIVIYKTTDSAFNSQFNLDRILRYMGIQQLLICGVVTNGCVESTVRDAADYGYDVTVVGDACNAFNQVQHEFALMEHALFYARVRRTTEVLDELSKVRRAPPKSKLEYSTIMLPDATRRKRLESR